MMLEYPIIIFFVWGLIIRAIPHEMKTPINVLSVIGAVYSLFYGIFNFAHPFTSSFSTLFKYGNFPGLIALACTFFGFIVVIFSIRYANFIELLNKYYAYIFFSIGCSLLTVYSTNLLVLLIFWGLQGLTLYLLSNLLPGSSNASKKSYAFIGGSDAIMLLGIAILWSVTNSLDIYKTKVVLGSSVLTSVSFLCLVIGSLTKGGAMPFHSWVQDFSRHVPISLSAFFPASLDKLLGIFLLVVVCNHLFVINTAMSFLLLFVGAVTIISAVSMALVQHDLKKLLSYHSVSQVGYMIVAIATGTPLGLAAGIFHMLNNTVYKSGLFLVASSVEYRTGKTNMYGLGGLSRSMPFTFAVCLICSLSIAGVPPFSGFASKWMIYLSLIEKFNATSETLAGYAYILFLVTAMFASALTLASFIKVIHSVFLGQSPEKPEDAGRKVKEVGFGMGLSMGILAVICLLFGIFPYSLPLKGLIYPALSGIGINPPSIPGLWRPDIATAFILFGLLLGVIIYLLGGLKLKKSEPFIGGEEAAPYARFSGTEFYKTISEMRVFKKVFMSTENVFFDIYRLGGSITRAAGGFLSSFHTGALQFYLLLFLIGLIGVALAYITGSVF